MVQHNIKWNLLLEVLDVSEVYTDVSTVDQAYLPSTMK